ncbi:MAG: CRISPR-associated primase-polymerase type B [Lutibacter sp.]|nr:CRISPR-associated primase-polymerase type B [Lutibacter sp.]
MLQSGKNITHADDQLFTISVDYFINAVRNPKEEIKTHIRQLRMLQSLDVKKYSLLKRQLPYIVSAIFKPAFRRKSNFAHISYFILDLDHLAEKGLVINNLRTKLVNDKRVLAVFESPGGDGLKIMFKLREKCYDEVKYSLFYKLFSRNFADEYKMQQVVDTVTSDVTRACFISHDPDVYYNSNAETINIDDFINFDDLYAVKQIEREIKVAEMEQEKEQTEQEEVTKATTISSDLLNDIKRKLNPNVRLKPQKNIVVPEILEDIMPAISDLFSEKGIKIINVTGINYGKKMNFELGGKQAEINLFYGQRGYSVVKSPKNGMNEELNDICHRILCEFLFGVE